MSEQQILAIKCAYADLVGALQCYEQQSYSDHDWDAHKLSIKDLENCFDFLDKQDEDNSTED